MRSRRTSQLEVETVARRRLELLSAELAATRPVPDDVPLPGGVESVGSGEPSEHPDPAPPGRPGRHAWRPVRSPGRLDGWVEDRLPPSLQGRVRLGAGHLALLTTVAAVAMALLAWSVVRGHDPGDLAPARAEVHRHGGASAPAAGPDQPLASLAPGSPEPEPTAAAEVVVDVAGKVRRPGIVTLPAGSRVVDALEAAGGPRRGVDLVGLNLARVLVDGEQVVVGRPAVAGPAAAAVPGPSPGAGALVNLNTATQPDLETLPGVGPVTAQAILDWRTEHGAFSSVDELLEVSGIGDATLAEIAPHVTI
jgi:competence protein ComEA